MPNRDIFGVHNAYSSNSNQKLSNESPFLKKWSGVFNDFKEIEEVIIISGQPSNHKNKSHFLINGLARAMSAKVRFQTNNKQTLITWIIFNDTSKEYGQDPKLLQAYKEKAKKLLINVIEVSNVNKIINYVNEKDGNDTRKKCLIAGLYYIGHATPGELRPGYQGDNDKDLDPSDFNSNAFTTAAYINLVGGCRTDVEDWFEDSVAKDFAEILTEESKIYSSDVRVEYSGGIVNDEQLVKPNKGHIKERKGELTP